MIAHVVVMVPARDEEALIGRCLWSIQAARAVLPEGVTSDLIVVSDGSRDRTVALATEIVGEAGLVLSIDAGNVGTARALAARAALARHTGALEACWMAHTDADCEVPTTWLVDQLASASRGALAVAGIIDVVEFGDHDANVPGRFRSTYLLNDDGTHPHVHGANLGIRADAFERAGGWSPLALAEEHDLWGRIDGIRISDSRLKVITSGRRTSRVTGGFAHALAAHNDP